MTAQTLFLVLLAAMVSLGMAWYQYLFKANTDKVSLVLASLRFLTYFSLLLLLIDPKLEKEDISLEKTNLVLVVDNSSSIEALGGSTATTELVAKFKSSTPLGERFNLKIHRFGNGYADGDSLTFDQDLTNISKALKNLTEVYSGSNNTFVPITDGNQNIGADYEYLKVGRENTLFPIIVGDTTRFEDFELARANVNRYTFLKNQFPFEATVVYNGKSNVSTTLNVFLDGRTVYQEKLQLSPTDNSKTISGTLASESVGLKTLRFAVSALAREKNKRNNDKSVAIEVLDEQLKIALVSSILHPDLGMLKKSIEKNEQRLVTVVDPLAGTEALDRYDFYILYQPDRSFGECFTLVERKKSGSLVITGPQTDWPFLNSAQKVFAKESFNQNEEIIPLKNEAYGVFDISGLNTEYFPPLSAQLGELTINTPYDALLWQQIKGVSLDDPLLFTFENEGAKQAVLLGENSWQWRTQNYREHQNFEAFDAFMDRLMRYLSDKKPRQRLELRYEPIFTSPSMARVAAAYYDESYTLQTEANLVVQLKNTEGTTEVPMLLVSQTFEADLSNLRAGEYEFTVRVEDSNISKSGRFTILDFDLEGQMASANDQKLARFAINNSGQLYYPQEFSTLEQKLLEDDRFTPVQKSTKNLVSLVDFRWFLVALALSLSFEWFTRKYNGLI